MQYKFFEHTADAKFQAYGKNLEEAFSNAALAMFSLMFKKEQIEEKLEKKISVEGIDLKELLVKWLDALLFLLDAEFFVFKDMKKIKINKTKLGYELTAVVLGDKFKESYERRGGVKAATYQEMFIEENLEKVTVQIVVDV